MANFKAHYAAQRKRSVPASAGRQELGQFVVRAATWRETGWVVAGVSQVMRSPLI